MSGAENTCLDCGPFHAICYRQEGIGYVHCSCCGMDTMGGPLCSYCVEADCDKCGHERRCEGEDET
jgi:hypothetical protein